MDINANSILAGFFFGVWGIYFLRQGKSHANMAQVVVGLALMLYPYAIDNAILLWLTGFGLMFVGWRSRG